MKPSLWMPRRHVGMVYSRCMKLRCAVLLCFLLLPFFNAVPQTPPTGAADYSGMYSFLKEGEFVQITIEEKGVVSGFISRYGDSESDKGSFLDQFFKTGKIDGDKLTFTTENVHGTWFTFEGTLGRGSGNQPQDEGYYLVRGTLTRSTTGSDNKTTSQARQVEFKSFPRDTSPPQ